MTVFTVATGAALAVALLALVVQWRDCIPGRGNSMGIRPILINLWMLAAIATGIAVSRVAQWWWALAASVAVMVVQRGIVEMVERVGRSREAA